MNTKILDYYIKRPLLYDLILSTLGALLFFLAISKWCIIDPPKQEIISNLFSDLSDYSISLAGFVLASLTIIVTFKDNIRHKDLTELRALDRQQQLSGIDLLFSGKHYKRVVGVFTWASVIFLLIFFILSIIRLVIELIILEFQAGLVVGFIILITLTVLRSLNVLYNIIKLQI